MTGRLGLPLRISLSPALVTLLLPWTAAFAQVPTPVPPDQRGSHLYERLGHHDGANMRTRFWNYGMVGDYPPDPGNVDLSVFHSLEIPKGVGLNYTDGITPFVLARVQQRDATSTHIMETGYRERQGTSPFRNLIMRFEPRPGYFQPIAAINAGRSPAVSNDPRTWPDSWPDKLGDPTDPGWRGSWNGYFGKRPAADQESFVVMDDDYYDAWNYFPDSRDTTRRGLGLRVEVRGFQWANPQSANVIFWHYEITNESTTDYNENIIFGLYMDSGVGGSALSCDGIYESDDDNAFFDTTRALNLVYTWDKFGHGVGLASNCVRTGYIGYAYLETPGKPFDGIDNDKDGIRDEKRDGDPGQLIIGQQAIEAAVNAQYNVPNFEATFGPLRSRPAYRAGRWWRGDEDLDWVAELHDAGADGVFGTNDTGEGDGVPTNGETNFDKTDLAESDQIGLTGFKMNRIRAPSPGDPTDDIVFFDDGRNWPQRLYDQFTNPNPAMRFDSAVVLNYNIGFLFASGTFTLRAGQTERFSLALAYGADLTELRSTVKTVQLIYNANYQYAQPPPLPTLRAESGDGYVRLSWDDAAERGTDPITGINDFEGYRIYRTTDPEFRDPRVILTGRGTGPFGHGRPIAQFDLIDSIRGYSNQVIEGVAYWLGEETGITHTYLDTTVTNGQLYYYALTSYDFGSDFYGFYPSENSIAVSRTPRGGTILPINVVAERPNPKTLGFVPAAVSNTNHAAGTGTGTINVQVVNSEEVPDGHLFVLRFKTPSPDSIRAVSYDFADSTAGRTIFKNSTDLDGKGTGHTGVGLLPIVITPPKVLVDAALSGFTPTSSTNVLFNTSYQFVRPINLRRPGYPENITMTFSNVPIDTSIPGIGLPARPAKFRLIAHADTGDIRMKFRFRDLDLNGTLSTPDEYVDVITYVLSAPTTPVVTWRVRLDTTGQAGRGPIVPPDSGDVYQLILQTPFSSDDVFTFTTTGQRFDQAKAQAEFAEKPYVVPNPYVGAASFEPERFAVSGRGERRIEFRSLPRNCVIRIYTLRGELVQTLRHDGSENGFVAWNLRTKDNLEVAPGLYIFHADAGDLGTHIGKFAIIK